MIPLVLNGAYCAYKTLHPVSSIGVVLGLLTYSILEKKFHRDMHLQELSPFYKTHEKHHLNPTPETGCPELWMFGFYFFVSLSVFLFNGPFVSSFWFGISCMLFMYEFIHFLCHCPYKPKTRYGRRIKRNHLKHHYVSDRDNYEMLINVKG